MKPTFVPRIVVLLALAGGAALLPGCSRSQATASDSGSDDPRVEGERIVFPDNAPQVSRLKIDPAQGRLTTATGLNGRLAWDEEVTARVFSPVSGRVVEMLVNPGQTVAAGDVLAKIRSTEFGQAQAEARKAVADLTVAERALSRVRELHEHGAAAAKDVEAAEAGHSRALSEKERAIATLALYGGSVETPNVDGTYFLKAPVAGLVVEKALNPGQEVRTDQSGDRPLFVITDPARLWALLDATEQDLVALKPGAEVKLRTRTFPDKEFTAHIDVVSDYVDPRTRTIKVRGELDNSNRLLKAEMFVTAELPSPLQAGVDVPTSAIFLKGDRHYLFVEQAKGTYQRQQVDIGPEQSGQILIRSGVQLGQNVVSDGGLLLNQILAERVSDRQ